MSFPGMMVHGFKVAAVATPITTLTYQTSTTSSLSTITAPASISAGDLLILVQRADNGTGTPTDVTPSGWTDIPTSDTGGTTRVSFKYKIAAGTEDGTTLTGMNGNNQNDKVCLQYRANKAITALSVSALIKNKSDADPAPQTMTASGGTGITLGITNFSTLSPGTIAPRTTSITPDHELNSSTRNYVHDYKQTSSPANYTWDMDDEGTDNFLTGCYFHSMVG